MTYVLSDIHGFWGEYNDFLDAVNFSDNDRLYIIGDIIDRGSDSIQILQDIMARQNIVMTLGNHEEMNLFTFKELCRCSKSVQSEIIRDEVEMQAIGQEDTLYSFCQLSPKERQTIIDYISALPLYQEVTVNSQEYFLVHSGLPDFSEHGDIEFYSGEELLFGEHDFTERHIDNTTVIVGHVPTRFISGAEPDKIFRCGDSIAIDCGLGFGGQLGVLCLETGEEFYF